MSHAAPESNSNESIAIQSYQACQVYGAYERIYQESVRRGLTPEKAHYVASRATVDDPFVLRTGISPEIFRRIYQSPDMRIEVRWVCGLPEPLARARAVANRGPTIDPASDMVVRRPPGEIFIDQLDTLKYQPLSLIGFGIGMLKYPDDPSLTPKERWDNRERRLQIGQIWGTAGDIATGMIPPRDVEEAHDSRRYDAPNSQRHPYVFGEMKTGDPVPIPGPPPAAPGKVSPTGQASEKMEERDSSEREGPSVPDAGPRDAGTRDSGGRDAGSGLTPAPAAAEMDMLAVFDDLPPLPPDATVLAPAEQDPGVIQGAPEAGHGTELHEQQFPELPRSAPGEGVV
ncbi:hypothetical protein [Streptomyces sp. NPDC056948]|uniref:hypothetical protein n=1 Tax=Streptomyces sp. NPDC056948 TaxID=3345975 RepID=UPI0036386234